MSRKKSKYKPKGVRLDAVTWVINGFRSINETGDAALHLKIKNHSSLEALRTGSATKDDIDNIIAALNVTEALARMNIGEDYAKEIRAGQDALFEIAKRGINRDNRFIAKGPELVSINTAYEVHDAQLEVCTIAQLEKALDIVNAEIKARKARVIK